MEQDEGFSDEPDEDRKKDMRLVATIEYIVKEFWFAIWISKTKEDMLTAYDIHLFGMELPMLTVSERIILWNVFAQRYNLEEDVDTVLCANQYILTPKGIMDALRTAHNFAVSDGRSKIGQFQIIAGMPYFSRYARGSQLS